MAYTSIDDPSAHFQVATYSGSGGSGGHAIVNDGNSDLQPDWVWLKQRSYASSSRLMDSSRGGNKMLESDTTAAETTYGYISSFDTDGFTLGYSDNSFDGYGRNYVGWQWKANGGTTSSNTNGTITTTVQANTTAGFSIVTFTSPSSGSFSIGHGLGVKPDVVITKSLNGTSNWWTWHKDLTNDTTYYLDLSGTSAEGSLSNMWGTAGFTSSVFGMNYPASAYANRNYVAYCFASKQGYSKFGKYIGNGNAEGPFVYTGFKPRWIMQKNASTNATSWFIYDSKRDTGNPLSARLAANVSDAETSATYSPFDFCSNGFKLRDGTDIWNESGSTHIYMAFAENPFVTSTGTPTTAR